MAKPYRSIRKGSVFFLFCFFLAACGVEESTPTPLSRRTDDLAPSPTFLPLIPTDAEGSFVGRSNPTAAALAAEEEPSPNFVPGESTPLPTLAALPLQLFASDGVLLETTFYGTPLTSAPVILLLHDTNQDGGAWALVARSLQDQGYNVAVPDLRGHGNSGGQVDIPRSVGDLDILIQTISGFSYVSGNRLILVGVGHGANIAMMGCVRVAACLGVVAISPRASENTEMDLTAITDGLNQRGVFFISADDDAASTGEVQRINVLLTDDHTWQRYSDGGRGITLFETQTTIRQAMIDWIRLRMPPA